MNFLHIRHVLSTFLLEKFKKISPSTGMVGWGEFLRPPGTTSFGVVWVYCPLLETSPERRSVEGVWTIFPLYCSLDPLIAVWRGTYDSDMGILKKNKTSADTCSFLWIFQIRKKRLHSQKINLTPLLKNLNYDDD